MDADENNKNEINEILTRLSVLEERIAKLELGKVQPAKVQAFIDAEQDDEGVEFSDLNISISSIFETKLGEYGLAWLGNVVLFFAIAFLWQYFNDQGKPLVSLIVGLISVSGVFILARNFRNSFAYMSKMFNLFGYIILYFIVLRLHFYTGNPLLGSEAVTLILLLILVTVQFYNAVKKQSTALLKIAFTLAVITAFVSETTHTFFLISMITAGLAVYLFWKYNWWKSMIYVLSITFLAYLIWLLKDHVWLTKTPGDFTFQYAFTYFSLTTAIYSLVAFRKPSTHFPDHTILMTILFAGLGYSALMLSLVLLRFQQAYIPFFTVISVYSIGYSVLLKLYSPWKYSPALYALFGFFAISVTITGIYHFPDSFMLLICQSFLVLILALWYRSHIITLINTFLLLFLAIGYYATSGELNTVNFTIPAVAFLSARLINWQKERLNIRTDFIRNIYLFTLFFSLLYATHKGLPAQYITVTWLFIAGVYFVLSVLIKSIKYRWMGMANLLVSAVYLFIVDLAKTDLIFRILAFLAFAIISIGISAYYVKKLKKS